MHLRISVVRGVSGSSASNIQRVRERITALTSGISFDTIGVLKKAADGKKFTNPQRTSDFQTFQRTTHIFDAAKGNISFVTVTAGYLLAGEVVRDILSAGNVSHS